MSKAVISNRIYFKPPTQEYAEFVKSELTYVIEDRVPGRGGVTRIVRNTVRNYKLFSGGIMSIPQGRLDLLPEGTVVEDKRVENPMPFPLPKAALRPDQQEVADQVDGSCFINALVGWGKTFTALHIARTLGQKTLVVTHTAILRDQWAKEIRTLFDMEPGIIGSGKIDIEPTIVVSNIQTLVKIAGKISKEFGTVIIDEAHHTPANTFSQALDQMHAKYKIGLSGTMLRADGMHVVFKDYFGDKVFKPKVANTLAPTVKILKTGLALPEALNWASRINKLLYDPDYQEYVAVIAKTQIAKGHKVLIVAERVEFLERVKEIIGESCVLVTGETSLEEREQVERQLESGEKSCIAGSRQIFSEGISINILSCLILASPIAGVVLLEQLIGRIMRKHPNKLHPEVYDLNFSGRGDKKQNNARLAFYLEKGWDIDTI